MSDCTVCECVVYCVQVVLEGTLLESRRSQNFAALDNLVLESGIKMGKTVTCKLALLTMYIQHKYIRGGGYRRLLNHGLDGIRTSDTMVKLSRFSSHSKAP